MKKKKIFVIAIALIFLTLILFLLFQKGFISVGFTIETEEKINEKITLKFEKNTEFIWEPAEDGQLTSLKLTGKVFGNHAKVYLDNILIFNNQEYLDQKNDTSGFSILTGKVTEESIPIEEENETEEEITIEETIPSTETTNEEPIIKDQEENNSNEDIILIKNENTTSNETLNETKSPVEAPNESIPIENDTKSNESLDITEDKEIIDEPKDIEEIVQKTENNFIDACIDTCNLTSLNLTKSNYTIRIELNNSQIEISNFNYKIEPQQNLSKLENKTKEEIIEESEVEVKTIQFPAKIGEPVKWKKEIKGEKKGLVKLDLPKNAEKIKINKKNTTLNEETEEPIFSITGNVIGEGDSKILNFFKKIFGRITGKVIESDNKIDIVIKNETITYEVEYETTGPIKIEKEISEEKKEITIKNEHDLHIENILSFTDLPIELNEGDFVLYKLTNGTKTRVPTTNYDKNNNGKIDYIEWVIPRLSEVVYVLDLTVLNIESSVETGNQWIVQFHTIGKNTLKISGVQGTDIEYDAEIKEIRCGDNSVDLRWRRGKIEIKKYKCDVNSVAIFQINTEPPHYAEFSFSGVTQIASTKAKGGIMKKEDFQGDSPLGLENYPGTGNCAWLTNQANDGTSSGSTGPEIDHTIGPVSNGGRFMFIETSYGYCNTAQDSAEISFPVINLTEESELNFWYHMFGSDIGTLEVYANEDKIFSISGEQQISETEEFEMAKVDLKNYSGDVNIKFKSIAKGGWRGDMAVDDISITSKSGSFNNPPTIPLDIYCDGSPNCDIDVLEAVTLSAKGSLDTEGDFIEYQIEANMKTTDTKKIETNKEILAPSDASETTPKAIDCDSFYNNDCSEGPPENFDNTFDDCNFGSGNDESVNNIYLPKDIVSPGEILTATCEFDPYDNGDYSSIWYYDTITWTKIYEHKNWGSNDLVNESISFAAGNNPGTHYIRCSISYNEDADNCADTDSWFDNDDLAFEVRGEGVVDTETDFTEYLIPQKDYSEINSIEISIEISEYNAEASIGTSVKPDLELEVFNGNSWISIGELNIGNIYTGSGRQTYKSNITKKIQMTSVLDGWKTKENQKIRLKGIYLDKTENKEDKIIYKNIWTSINSKNWTAIGEHGDKASFDWTTLTIDTEDCINLRTKAIDKEGSKNWTSYFTKDSCLNIVKGESSREVRIENIVSPQIINPIEGGQATVEITIDVYARRLRNLRNGFVTAKISHATKEKNLENCVEISQIDKNTLKYSCSGVLESYDPAGKWTIFAHAEDDRGRSSTNAENEFQYNLLLSIDIIPKSISFDLTTTDINQKGNTYTTITNKGNYDASNHIIIRPTKLIGKKSPEEFIKSEFFKVGISDDCLGTPLITDTDVIIQNTQLPPGENSKEELYYCIPAISGISTQQYSTNQDSWIIKLD